MGLALEEAETAYKAGEVPVGAVVVGPMGEVLARSGNIKESTFDPCGHAEILAIRSACEKIKNWRLTDCSLYVTLEPCLMCMSALVHSRISSLHFGAYDKKAGALSLGYDIHNNPKLNHTFSVTGGHKHYECSNILSRFFRERRKNYRS